MDDLTQITYIGKVDYRNKMTKFGIKPRDRTKHMYIIGKTGTGKSTLLENMIVQDIQNGHGVAFIDPHGGSADKLLDYIPEWRINDVIYFNPSDMEYPVAFNPLEDPGPEKRHLVTDGLMSVFKKIWPEAFSGRMEYILNMTMMALMEYPDSTILSINRMLTDKDFRKRVIASVTDTAVRNAWDELMKWDDKRWSEAIGALVNKVGQFSTNPVIRNIIGQPKSTFDFRKAMDERKIVIINLSKGMIGEQNAPLLGAMLITKIYLSAMSRAEMPAHVIERMPPFYFYVDEFQNFANESFASILSEARKYKLCLTVANQFIAQMEETIRDAVFGNMGTTVSFRVGPLDAEFMERVFAPVFTQEDLQNIAFGQYYLTLQIDNMGSKPFSAQGLPPIPPPQTSMKTRVIEASRRNYASNREEVEARVKEFFGYAKKTIHSQPVSNAEGEILAHVTTNAQGVRMSGGTGVYIKPASSPKPVAVQKSASIVTPATTPDLKQPTTQKQSFIIPKPPAQQQAQQIPQVQQRADTPTEIHKKLEPITGYRKSDNDRMSGAGAKTVNTKTVEEKPQVSDSLSLLLNRLDEVVVDVKRPEVPSTLKPTAQKSEFKPLAPKPLPQMKVDQRVAPQVSHDTQDKVPKAESVSKQVQQVPSPVKLDAVKPAPKKLDRAASTEQKSALQEALARAMAKNTEKPAPAESIQKISEKPRIVQASDSDTQEEKLPPATARTIREVPEDILRRVLE